MRTGIPSTILFGLLLLLAGCPSSVERDGVAGGADIVLLGGTVWTMDENQPRAEALAIRDDRIVAVGSSESVAKWINTGTRVIRLNGEAVCPGFVDAHCHLSSGGRYELQLDLRDVPSLAALQERVREWNERLPDDVWLVGRGWDHTIFPEGRPPERRDLDPFTRSRPCFLTRIDGHIAVANSAALQEAGLLGEPWSGKRDARQPEGGRIDIDPYTGQPNGILRERAMALVGKAIPPLSDEAVARGMEAALKKAASLGLTTVHTGGDPFSVLERLRREDRLTIRVRAWGQLSGDLSEQARHREKWAGDPLLSLTCLKGFVDGSLGSRTAAMLEPYADDLTTRGILRISSGELNRRVLAAHEAGFQVALHAIGDRANRVALDAFAHVRRQGTKRDARHRVEHAQIVQEDDVARFAELGVVASMQPCHLMTDMRWAADRLGASRLEDAYAWGRMLDAGVVLAFGTDWPVEPLDPLANLYAATTRRNRNGRPVGGWGPGRALTLSEALEAMTVGPARASFEEELLGRLVPGAAADVVVLDHPLDPDRPADLLKTEAKVTICAGRIVHEK